MFAMKKILYTTLACTVLFFGCSRDGEQPSPKGKEKEKTRVELSGAIQASSSFTRGEGMIHPDLTVPTDPAGLPPRQLRIGIMTIELDQAAVPTVPQWFTGSAYLDHGFFGGVLPGDDPISDGNIEYTNRDGTALQQVFYREDGWYYHFVCVYPYEYIIDPEDLTDYMTDPGTGASVHFDVDGSQDIMASTLGSGNIEFQFEDSLVFSHKLTALRCKFIAESAIAASNNIYGDIVSVELIDQPGVIGLNIGQQALGTSATGDVIFVPASSTDVDYPAVRSSSADLTMPYPLTGTPAEFGYMLAKPAKTYTFRITTTERYGLNALYATYDFDPTSIGTLPAAGTIYNLTFRMLETAGIELVAAVADEWWLDQTFN